jgi:hypothetical protein
MTDTNSNTTYNCVGIAVPTLAKESANFYARWHCTVFIVSGLVQAKFMLARLIIS